MFTGITEQVGKIESLEHSPDGGRLRISFRCPATPGRAPENNSDIAASTKLGDSISVNGCCLTSGRIHRRPLLRRSLRRNSPPHQFRGKKTRPPRQSRTPPLRRRPPRWPFHARARGRHRPRHPPRPRRRKLVALRPRPARSPPLRRRKRLHRPRWHQPHRRPLARRHRRHRHHPLHLRSTPTSIPCPSTTPSTSKPTS